VGNAKVNARGDKLGPNGQIIQRREDAQRINETPAIPEQTNVRKSVNTVKNVVDMDPEGNE
jgi:hypothetical protein